MLKNILVMMIDELDVNDGDYVKDEDKDDNDRSINIIVFRC